jgi:hypothetical protein
VVDHLDPPVEEVSDRGGLVRDPFGLDLGDEPIPRALGRRPVRVGLLEVDLPAGDGVLTCIDDGTEASLEGPRRARPTWPAP